MAHTDQAVVVDVRSRLGQNRVYADHSDASFRSSVDFGRSSVDFGWLGPIVGTIQAWLERHRQRQALNLLDDQMLKDIGLTRLHVECEIRKPFWQA